ncbi:unnamed protein product [Rangifer tarandus platyrhynchus]|uniref:Uncharacterized protein n=2 Tax=Rangifer tarandus platyrhynchus TaxID=3082113 RepID=A0AC59ZY39_RANTA|nr:unnamed protein product [Rangifer tarandus platyrhynchus]
MGMLQSGGREAAAFGVWVDPSSRHKSVQKKPSAYNPAQPCPPSPSCLGRWLFTGSGGQGGDDFGGVYGAKGWHEQTGPTATSVGPVFLLTGVGVSILGGLRAEGRGGAAPQEPGPLAHHSGLGRDFMLAWSLASAWTVPLETRTPPLTLTLTLGRDPHTCSLLTSPDSPLWALGPQALSGGPAVGDEQVYSEPQQSHWDTGCPWHGATFPGPPAGTAAMVGTGQAPPGHRPGAALCTCPAGHLPAQHSLGSLAAGSPGSWPEFWRAGPADHGGGGMVWTLGRSLRWLPGSLAPNPILLSSPLSLNLQ